MKFFKSFFGKLIVSHLIIILITLTVIGVSFIYLIQNYYFGLKEWDAIKNGRRVAKIVSENISEGNLRTRKLEPDQDKIYTIARSANMDIGLMNIEGEIVLNHTSIKDFTLTLEEQEIDNVLKGNSITKKIMGPKYKNLLLVFPLFKENKGDNNPIIMGPQVPENSSVIGAIIIQTPLGSITSTVNNIINLAFYSFIVALIAAILLSISFSHKFTKPLAKIKRSAQKITQGSFHKVEPPQNSSEEINHLVNTYNYAVDKVNETLARQKHLEKVRKEFVANVSHEFRAPLTSIKGFLELIKDNNLSTQEIKEYTEIMHKDAEYLEHLVSELIILSQLDAKKVKLKKEYIYPCQLIKRAIKTLKTKIDEKHLTVNTDNIDNLPKIKVDKNKFYQVLINLLKNAVKYSPEKGIITISGKVIENSNPLEVKFSITDQGPGINEKEKNKIWQRFYKSDIARTREEKEGSGLGLSIVKDIIEKHNGKIGVKNRNDRGAIFYFIIPVEG